MLTVKSNVQKKKRERRERSFQGGATDRKRYPAKYEHPLPLSPHASQQACAGLPAGHSRDDYIRADTRVWFCGFITDPIGGQEYDMATVGADITLCSCAGPDSWSLMNPKTRFNYVGTSCGQMRGHNLM